jgi:hypothetical protein
MFAHGQVASPVPIDPADWHGFNSRDRRIDGGRCAELGSALGKGIRDFHVPSKEGEVNG